MEQPASSCMRSAHPSAPIWGCMRSPHSGVPAANLQSPYQQAPFSLHQKPEFLAYTDFSSSCLVPTPPHASYPRDDRPYTESQGGYQRAEWQFNPCETRVRAPEACPQVVANPTAAAATGSGGGGSELDGSVGAVAGCLDGGEYSPQSATSADSDKKSSGKRKRETSGEWLWEGRAQGRAAPCSEEEERGHSREIGVLTRCRSVKTVWFRLSKFQSSICGRQQAALPISKN